jgi:hypothetical protein
MAAKPGHPEVKHGVQLVTIHSEKGKVQKLRSEKWKIHALRRTLNSIIFEIEKLKRLIFAVMRIHPCNSKAKHGIQLVTIASEKGNLGPEKWKSI